MNKEYSSVIDLLKDVSDDKEFNKSVQHEINSKQISKVLFSLRCKANLTQKVIAEKMNYSQAKVSKMENLCDMDLTIGDIAKYCSAVDMKLEIGFSDMRMTLVDRVKYHFFKLKEMLDKKREISKGDASMEKGVEIFTKEAFFNITAGLLDCLGKIKPRRKKKEIFHVSEPVNIEDLKIKT